MRKAKVLGIVLLAMGSVLGLASAQTDLKSFQSKTYRYSVQYPAAWFVDATRTSDTFDIDDFPASRAVHAVHLPANGAKITLAPLDASQPKDMPKTIDDWVRIETVREKVVAKRTLELARSDGKQSIVEVRTEENDDPPFLETVNWYFQIDGRLFEASLLYWRGNPDADKLLQTLQQIVLSLKLM